MTNHARPRAVHFVLAALIALPFWYAVSLTSCATLQPVVQPVLTKVGHVVKCDEGQIASQLPAIVTEVATDLLSQNYVGLLVDLAKRVGDDTVVCAVASSGASAAARMASTSGAQPNAATIKVHADDYLQARGLDPKTLAPDPAPAPPAAAVPHADRYPAPRRSDVITMHGVVEPAWTISDNWVRDVAVSRTTDCYGTTMVPLYTDQQVGGGDWENTTVRSFPPSWR